MNHVIILIQSDTSLHTRTYIENETINGAMKCSLFIVYFYTLFFYSLHLLLLLLHLLLYYYTFHLIGLRSHFETDLRADNDNQEVVKLMESLTLWRSYSHTYIYIYMIICISLYISIYIWQFIEWHLQSRSHTCSKIFYSILIICLMYVQWSKQFI